ncbi:MAG: HAD hydrolase-like protein [Oscillospiraceae bacterium]|jgi:phosphoglycolate phosphatase|nr:HAD hydrolase-like protein [Oscillospiraceae bacterium]
MINTIVWDWNGTLLDDAACCVDVENSLLAERGITPLLTLDTYREIFGFPIRDYYAKAGLSFETESYESLANIYMNRYMISSRSCKLFADAEDTLKRFKEAGYRQIILSASETKNLAEQVGMFDIGQYLNDIAGVDDIYAHGKIDIAKRYFERNNINPARVLLIGDTTHDSEVAEALSCDCWLITNGHHNQEKLARCGRPLFGSLSEAANRMLIR